MISYIKGRIVFTEESSVSVLASSVGWDINVYSSIDYQVGEEYEFFIYMHQTDKSSSLWGFKSLDELKFFKLLLQVSGVGPRTASSLLWEKGIKTIVGAINSSDFKTLKTKGLGDKVSQKIILELKDKIPESYDYDDSDNLTYASLEGAIEALKSLGYSTSDISKTINSVGRDNLKDLNESEVIKLLLKSI